MGSAGQLPPFTSAMLLLCLSLIPSISTWSIVENKNRSTPLGGIQLPRFGVQVGANETLSEEDKIQMFVQWGQTTISKAASEGRLAPLEIKMDSACYPGPPTTDSRFLFFCDQLHRANETVSEAQDFFKQIRDSNQSLAAAPAPVASQFSWHFRNVQSLQENLPMASGDFGKELAYTFSLGSGLLASLPPADLTAFNEKLGALPFRDHPPPPQPRGPRPCRWNTSDMDRLLNNTGVPADWVEGFLRDSNATDLEDEICGNSTEYRHPREWNVCDRAFWQRDVENSTFFRRIGSIFGNQLSTIEHFVDFARNRSLSDANFTAECRKLLNSTNLGQALHLLRNGTVNLTSILQNLNGSGLLSNFGGGAGLLGMAPNRSGSGSLSSILQSLGLPTNISNGAGLMNMIPGGANSSLSSLLSSGNLSSLLTSLGGGNGTGIASLLGQVGPGNVTSLLSSLNSTSNPLLGLLSATDGNSAISSVKTAILNGLGPQLPQVGALLKTFAG